MKTIHHHLSERIRTVLQAERRLGIKVLDVVGDFGGLRVGLTVVHQTWHLPFIVLHQPVRLSDGTHISPYETGCCIVTTSAVLHVVFLMKKLKKRSVMLIDL